MDEYIRRQDAVDAFGLSEKTRKYGGDHSGYDTRMLYEIQDTIESIEPAADVVPYSIEPDGTLTVTVPKGTKRIGRILVEEDGTQYGGLFYPDTGGCFLSSMERSDKHE